MILRKSCAILVVMTKLTTIYSDRIRTLGEYKRRFDLLLTQNDESLIPSDLRGSIFSQSVKHGGLAEYEKVPC
jgi:hypothetical protein